MRQAATATLESWNVSCKVPGESIWSILIYIVHPFLVNICLIAECIMYVGVSEDANWPISYGKCWFRRGKQPHTIQCFLAWDCCFLLAWCPLFLIKSRYSGLEPAGWFLTCPYMSLFWLKFPIFDTSNPCCCQINSLRKLQGWFFTSHFRVSLGMVHDCRWNPHVGEIHCPNVTWLRQGSELPVFALVEGSSWGEVPQIGMTQ